MCQIRKRERDQRDKREGDNDARASIFLNKEERNCEFSMARIAFFPPNLTTACGLPFLLVLQEGF